MQRADHQDPTRPHSGYPLFSPSDRLPLPVYRDFLDMLFSMRLPIVGFGVAFVVLCVIAALELEKPIYFVLAALATVTTLLRLATLDAYARALPIGEREGLRRWERLYAAGSFAFGALLGLLNAAALSSHHPVWHLITVSLVFAFGAGVVSRISVRPIICIVSLLLATVPTVAALAWHAFVYDPDAMHFELYFLESLLVLMITGLSLQSVAYLYRSAVEHHTAKHDLASLAKFDPLTGLANRLMLRERFQDAIANVGPGGGGLALHFLDLDGFKAVNDRYGHPVGDALLEQVARRLESIVRAEDTVARLGGDEFIVLQNGLQHEDEAEMLARRVIRQLSLPYLINDTAISVSVSVGIALASRQGLELARLLSCADAALYRAKAGGKAQALFCSGADMAKLDLAA